jgi:hypothetical protein
MSIASLCAVRILFWQRVFVWLMRACKAQPDSIGTEDQDEGIFERDFSGLPGGFVAVVRVLPVEAGLIGIGGDPMFDGLPGWLEGLTRTACLAFSNATEGQTVCPPIAPSRERHF